MKPMSTCDRCGLPKGNQLQAVGGQACASGDMSALGDDGEAEVQCRDRELANLRREVRALQAEAFDEGIEAATRDCDCVGTDLTKAHAENPYR